ncbi:putative Brefeldin A-inhibited guanine nucleotide-exchange protein 2 [Cocos nucifera]|uniref:Putative Brefeldin A-inhibited guanine nucleotide-exchange protein 2 n=1 Tax=Cocos nucifera TaxID=13894 RepID=A0A8K0IGZ0_COCNU|nr:putative Brefeldin A-inhibited guanine nucleotide-exchange protein 2 [Cocos nucifera]
MFKAQPSVKNTVVLVEALHAVASHAHKINSDNDLRSKIQELGSMTQTQDLRLLRFENESYEICLALLQDIVLEGLLNRDVEVEAYFVDPCREILQVYLHTAKSGQLFEVSSGCQPRAAHWLIPVGSAKRRKLAAQAPLVAATLQAICGLGDSSFEKNLAKFFPLLASLIGCEHGSSEEKVALSDMLGTWVGPVLLQSC